MLSVNLLFEHRQISENMQIRMDIVINCDTLSFYLHDIAGISSSLLIFYLNETVVGAVNIIMVV